MRPSLARARLAGTAPRVGHSAPAARPGASGRRSRQTAPIRGNTGCSGSPQRAAEGGPGAPAALAAAGCFPLAGRGLVRGGPPASAEGSGRARCHDGGRHSAGGPWVKRCRGRPSLAGWTRCAKGRSAAGQRKTPETARCLSVKRGPVGRGRAPLVPTFFGAPRSLPVGGPGPAHPPSPRRCPAAFSGAPRSGPPSEQRCWEGSPPGRAGCLCGAKGSGPGRSLGGPKCPGRPHSLCGARPLSGERLRAPRGRSCLGTRTPSRTLAEGAHSPAGNSEMSHSPL